MATSPTSPHRRRTSAAFAGARTLVLVVTLALAAPGRGEGDRVGTAVTPGVAGSAPVTDAATSPDDSVCIVDARYRELFTSLRPSSVEELRAGVVEVVAALDRLAGVAPVHLRPAVEVVAAAMIAALQAAGWGVSNPDQDPRPDAWRRWFRGPDEASLRVELAPDGRIVAEATTGCFDA